MSQYIGRRIVPVHGGVWDKSKDYEELTIVLYEAGGDSYISRRPVPAGTVIGDKNYWMLYSLYSAQIAEAVKQMEETDAAVRAELTATESRMETRVSGAESLTNSNKAELNSRMDGIDKRLDANVSASTDKDADYAAEVVDARVDSNGQIYASLGEAARRDDLALRSVLKVPITLGQRTLKGENQNESQGTVEQVAVGGRTVAADVHLSYIRPEGGGHFIRGFFTVPLADFQDKYSGHVLTVQIYSSEACDVLMGWGFLAAYKTGFTLQQVVSLKVGYNELQIDCGTEQFLALTIPEACTKFYLHYLFGRYGGMVNQPADGSHVFRFSVYDNTEIERILPGCDGVVLSAYSGYSDKAQYAAEAGHTPQADQAAEADHAAMADKAQLSDTAAGAGNAGAINAFQAMGHQSQNKNAIVDTDSGRVKIAIKPATVLASDAGFSVYIGTVGQLRGHDLLVYKDEAYPFTQMALNAGTKWGGGTYVDIQDKFVSLDGHYLVASFDALLNAVIAKGKTTADFDGDCYFMFYGNLKWDLSKLQNGETVYNQYGIYKCAPDNVVYSRRLMKWQTEMTALRGLCAELREECEMLDSERNAMMDSIDAVQKGNILWGKKWAACGDSFTKGDFSGYTDANGLSGKNSPELYDSVKKMYKTYPWWIGERNCMTVVNEAKCGSIMPLDKTYVDDPDHVAITTRNPFSLNRYKALPADADYITLWFGINDSSHTYLGEITDTTNETFFGAWNVVLQYLIENHPYAKIGIIITERGNAEYRNALREIAKKWGIPYLDMMGDLQVPVMMYRESELGLSKTAGDLRYNAFKVGPSNGHPNLKAHEYQSTFIEAFLRRL